MQTQMKNFFKKNLMFISSILVTVGVISAIWLFGGQVTGYSVYEINSNQPNVTITKQLLGGVLDLTNESQNFTDSIQINSENEELMFLSFNVTKTDIENDSCTDYINDCDIELYLHNDVESLGYGYSEKINLTTGQNISLIPGINVFEMKGYCKKLSCPQEISLDFNLIPVPN